MTNPLHSEYCHCECPAGNSYSKLEQTLNRVRRLHYAEKSNYYVGKLFCDHCSEWNGYDKLVPYPCDTIRAMQGACSCPPELLYKGDHWADCESL